MNVEAVITVLRELSGWLADSVMQKRIEQIIGELSQPNLSVFRLQQIKRELSKEVLFHPKCLGDVHIEHFRGEVWWDYLCSIEEICQRSL